MQTFVIGGTGWGVGVPFQVYSPPTLSWAKRWRKCGEDRDEEVEGEDSCSV